MVVDWRVLKRRKREEVSWGVDGRRFAQRSDETDPTDATR